MTAARTASRLGLLKAAGEAAAIENPMEAELFLNRFRMDFLESIRPRDMFAEDSVYYYGLKLKLMLRISRFDLKSGREAYRNITAPSWAETGWRFCHDQT